jgi:hypothetical protein
MVTKVKDRKRAAGVTVMMSDQERQEVRKAAETAGLSLSVFVRLITLAAIRSGQTISTAKAA